MTVGEFEFLMNIQSIKQKKSNVCLLRLMLGEYRWCLPQIFKHSIPEEEEGVGSQQHSSPLQHDG